MKPVSRRRHALHALGATAALVFAVASADTPAPDPTSWKCEQCPFPAGYEANVEAGAVYANGANASFGRYTGIDRDTPYLDAGATGDYRRADGRYANYDFERLGLASRDGVVEVGQDGRYDLKLDYDGQPTRLYDTGVTPFQGVGSGNLTLPANWVAAGSTAGMSALDASIAPVKIEYDRRTTSLSGSYIATPQWTFHAGFSRQEKDGTGLLRATFLIDAMQLPRPIDYVTDSFEAGVAWAGRRASLRLTYTGSWFKDNADSLTFANPYRPIVAGATLGRLALPPDNRLQQLAATGNVQLPWFSTTLTYAASLGTLKQNDSFLPVSTLPGSVAPAPGSLDGDVRLTHYALGLASRPWPKLSLHGNATYDGRDDRTAPLTVAYDVTDTFSPGGTAVTPRYGQDRTRLDGGADYALLRWLRLGIGGKYLDTSYAPGQVLSHSRDRETWGRATLGPFAGLSVTLRGGNASRIVAGYDAAELPAEENPLIRQFNYAPRDRVFYTLTGSWSVTPTLTWAIEGFLANDDYRLSPLGLQSMHQRRGSSTLTWSPSAALSTYVDGGYQRLYTLQNGYAGPATAPWLLADAERFWNIGAGGQWVIRERWTLALDYLHAPSSGGADTTVGGLTQAFPQNWSKLDTVQLDLRYRWTAALQLHLRFVHEKYDSSDWALDDVGPATVPDLLALGLQPFQHDVNLVGITVRYQFGSAAAPTAN